LDEVVNEHVDLIKIDVDGREIEVLEGAIKLINRFRPHIMIEIARENEEYFRSFLDGIDYGICDHIDRGSYKNYFIQPR